jgi:DNA polymerase-3 subunit gamma/tau
MATALYRRYRPESFADVIGQEHVTEPLMQALRTGRVNHAYLFSGPRGCGKTTSARILARCLNCEQGPTPTPCGVCDSCVALARGGAGSVDVIEIDAASHGGVDDARDLRERASYGPAQSRFKIYIIDEAHMVTPQGFNALLKIVEEPPEHVKFVFATTEPEKVIGTIRSRTHHYPFRLVPPLKLSAYMERLLVAEDVAVAPGVLSFVTRAGGGSVRDSLSVLDQLIAGSGPEGLTYDSAVSLLGFTDGELLDATVDALAAADGAATFRQIDKVIESGHDPRRFIEDLLERLRDLIIVAAVQEGAGQVLRGTPEDQLERMRVQQAAFGPGALSRAADIVNSGLTEMTGATAPRLQLELICARILLPAASGEQGYAARLDRLERRLDVGGVPSAARGSAPAAPPSGGMVSAPGVGGGPGERGAAPAGHEAAPVQAPGRTVSDYTPPPSGAPAAPREGASTGSSPAAGGMGGGRERDLSHTLGRDAAGASGAGASGAGVQAPGGSPSTAGAEADAARAAVGAPVVAVPDESVGGPSVVETGVDSVGDVVEPAAPGSSSTGVEAVGSAGDDAATAAPAAPAGGLDTDDIRRAWPTVLGRIFTMRRLTWTFVSQNAQVMAFDGRTLTLGIATAGLTTTFRSGNHSEVVRQALIDELGVDAVVDGVHVEDISQQPAVAPPAGAVPSENAPPLAATDHGQSSAVAAQGSSGGAQDSPTRGGGNAAGGDGGARGAGGSGAAGGSWGDAGAGHDPRGASRDGSGSGFSGSGGAAMAEAGLSPTSARSLQDNAGWGSPAGPAPDWATATTAPAAPAGSATPSGSASVPGAGGGPSGQPTAGGPGSMTAASGGSAEPGSAADARHARGASAVRESFAAARSASARRDVAGGAGHGPDAAGPAAPVTDDSAVSDDDEDIEQSGDVGRTVIEKVLGGRVVSETTD